MKKNIVVISTMYHPDMGAPSACVDKYVQCLREKYNFYIITKSYIYGVRDTDRIRYISNWAHKLTLWCENNIQISKKVLRSKVLLSILKVYKLILNQFAYPYFNSWEICKSYQILRNLSKEIKVDAVIPVSNTFFSQFAVLKFKKAYCDCKWISFITDPFSENDIYYKYKLFKKFWKRRNIENERRIYNATDYILLSEEMYKFVLKRFSISPYKAYNIGFALDDIRRGKHPQKVKSEGPTKLVYAGMFYQKIRNPRFMLSTLSQLSNIKIDLFVGKGECEDIINQYVSDKISRDNFVNRDRYEDMICNQYDILVNVGNVSTLQAPSKMLELLSTGRPILNFYFIKDSQYEMIEKYPLGLNVSCDETNAVQIIEVFCNKMKGKCLTFGDVLELYPEHALNKKVAFLESLIES